MGEFDYLKRFNSARVQSRNMDELIGLSRGMLADGKIVQEEAEFLQRWLHQAQDMGDDPIYRILTSRLEMMLADDVLDADESQELLEMLQALTGDNGKPTNYRRPSHLPLNDPLPDIDFQDRGFTFTGVMAFGPRKECQALVTERGGKALPGPSKKVHYLVIGTIANEHWAHSSYGRKIERALEIRESGHPLAIINEDHFISFAMK